MQTSKPVNTRTHGMTETEIDRLIFKDAEVYEARGLTDAFTIDEIVGILHHPDFSSFSNSFQTQVYETLDGIGDRSQALQDQIDCAFKVWRKQGCGAKPRFY